MSKKDQETIDVDSVRAILGWTGGGIHKRIDENRELVELLQHDGFLDRYPWAIEWLRSSGVHQNKRQDGHLLKR